MQLVSTLFAPTIPSTALSGVAATSADATRSASVLSACVSRAAASNAVDADAKGAGEEMLRCDAGGRRDVDKVFCVTLLAAEDLLVEPKG